MRFRCAIMETSKCRLQIVNKIGEWTFKRPPPRDQHIIESCARVSRRDQPYSLSQSAPNSVAYNRPAKLFGHSKAKACGRHLPGAIRCHLHCCRPLPCHVLRRLRRRRAEHECRSRPASSISQSQKICTSLQRLEAEWLVLAMSCHSFDQDCGVAARNRYADRRLRPFARRRASTFCPPFVALRARKPCRRFLTSRDGW